MKIWEHTTGQSLINVLAKTFLLIWSLCDTINKSAGTQVPFPKIKKDNNKKYKGIINCDTKK